MSVINVTFFKLNVSFLCLQGVVVLLLLVVDYTLQYKVSFIPNARMAQKSLLVYYSLRETLNTFDTPKYKNDTKVIELLHAFHHDCQLTPEEEQRLEYLENQSEIRRKPLIVVEGTDRDTRRIVAKKLALNIGAKLMGSPPTCLNPMREYFTDNLVLRRAYFSLCMYAGAINVTRHWYNNTVVMSAYWHDQATFSIAKKYTLRNMPPTESPIFDWPEDLIPPDVEFFINTPQAKGDSTDAVNTFKPRTLHEEVTKRFQSPKWKGRQISSTGLVEAYRRMKNPTVFEVAGNLYHDQIRFEMEIYLQKLYRDNYKFIINTT